VTVNGRLVVTFNEVGLAAAVAGPGLVSMTVGAARKEISEVCSCASRAKLRSRPCVHSSTCLLQVPSWSFLLGPVALRVPLGTSGHGAYWPACAAV